MKIKHLISIMFGHAKADVVTEILKGLEKLIILLKLMFSLGIDGWNVTQAILNRLNQINKGERLLAASQVPNKLCDSCLPQSFKKGIAKYGYDAEELCLNLNYFFKRSSHWWQDLFEKEESLGFKEFILLHHVQRCWLSIVPALEWIVKIKEAVNKLLLMELPKNDYNINKNDKYLLIKKALESKEVDTEMVFLISIIQVFDEFMTKFQREEPVIHL